MMATVNDIADWFLASIDRDAGDSITHLKLQKLVYYAQAWSLVLRGEKLFEEDFEAWAHGPVVRGLYERFSDCGWSALPVPEGEIDLTNDVCELLENISSSYGELGAKQLEDLTHGELPWLTARGNLSPEARSDTVISKESMKIYYMERYENLDGEA